jgi:predicted nucleic acid-binding protein
MVVIDATMLLLLLRPGTSAPAAASGSAIDKPKERVDFLVKQLDKAKTKIIVPSPALSETLVRAGASASQGIIEHLQRYTVFRIEAFDTRAAIEVAAMTREAIDSGKKRGAKSDAATWAKIKYDRQIVAIAKVAGATAIYSDDSDIAAIAARVNIKVTGLADLPLPPQDAQHELELLGSAEASSRSSGGDFAEEAAKTK